MEPGDSMCHMQKEIHEYAKSKGWWQDDRPFGDQMMNFHSEISEAWEDWRNHKGVAEIYYEGDKPCGIPIELADVVIRIMDTCEHYGIDLAAAIVEKHKYNMGRPWRHGDKKA